MLNKVILVGHLGADPELRHTQNQNPVANFNIAITEKFNGKENTTWIKITTWNKTAENVCKYLHKGSKALIEGRINVSKYTDKNGQERYDTHVVAQSVKFLDSKKSGGNDGREYGQSHSGEPGDPGYGGARDIDDAPF